MPSVLIDYSGKLGVPGNPGGQADFLSDWTHPFVAMEGGWMSGKTWAGARKLLTLHVFNAFDVAGQATYVPSVIVAPTYQNIVDFDLPNLFDAAKESGIKLVYKRGKQAVICTDLGTRKNPSLIMIRSAERPDRITGWEVGASWGDEATRWPENWAEPKRDAYLQLQGRVRHPKARVLQRMYTYTNEGDATRAYAEFNGGRPTHALYRAPTHENPLARNFEALQRETLTLELAQQYLEGDAINLRGRRAYDVFTAKLNVDESLVLRPDRPLHIAVDFNIDPGMHIEIGQYLEDEDLFTVVHEIHSHRLSLRDAIVKFQELIDSLGGWQWPGELHVFGDATGSSKWSGTGESCYQILQQGLQDMDVTYRIRVPRANPLVIDRVNAINVAMRDLKGRVHWQCHPRCKRLVEDMKKVKLNTAGAIEKTNPALTHASDAEGYRVAYLRPARVSSRKTAAGRIGFAPAAI